MKKWVAERRNLALWIGLLSVPAYATLPSDLSHCRPSIDPLLPQYIVGYGSLMQEKSKREDSANVSDNRPIYVTGFERGWIVHSDDPRFGTTYLGVRVKPIATLNAVYFKLNAPEDMRNYDEREGIYCRTRVSKHSMKPLIEKTLPEGEYWIYTVVAKERPTHQYPLVQSYVDVFLSGCLELESKFHLTGFAKDCVLTTDNWSGHWVNDRVYPRKAYHNKPYVAEIDSLIADMLPQYYKQIVIE